MVVSKSHLSAFTDVPFLNSHSHYFSIKRGLKLLKEKVGLRTAKRIITFEIASHFK